MKKADSAGGVVVRQHDQRAELLLIRDVNYDDWFLPKGHVEPGETNEVAALREIEEETGLNDLELGQFLGSFTRVSEQEKEIKTEYHFLFRKTGDSPIQLEKNMPWEARWFGLDNLPVFYISGQEKIIRDNIDLIKESV